MPEKYIDKSGEWLSTIFPDGRGDIFFLLEMTWLIYFVKKNSSRLVSFIEVLQVWVFIVYKPDSFWCPEVKIGWVWNFERGYLGTHI